MRIIAHPDRLDIVDGATRAGAYILNDPFKPFVHDLRTPGGASLSATSPHDHVHHKGLMYAFKCDLANFWEERDADSGQQTPLDLAAVNDEGAEVAFQQHLSWRDAAGGEIFSEMRRIACRREGDAYCWTWTSRMTARRDVTLVKSVYSWPRPAGATVNYHGLGLRLPRAFGGTGGTSLRVDGTTLEKVTDGMGLRPRSATLIGRLDPAYPQWPPPRASVTFESAGGDALFAMDAPFAYLAIGPSNLDPVPLRAGQEIEARHRIAVADER